MFYTFGQNNSGGSFTHKEEKGIGYNVVIEAHDVNHALSRATSIGLYFDGVANGRDCGCCGDRWSDWIDESDGTEVPTLYGQVLDLSEYDGVGKWGIPSYIHYLDGTIKKISGNPEILKIED